MFYVVVIQMTEPVVSDVDVDSHCAPSLTLPMQTRNDKRERKQTAQSLPPGITHNMMKKFVVYYRELVNLKNGKQIPREYFKVESHPKLTRPWVTTKSTKIPILEKLNQANEYVAKLDTFEETNINETMKENNNVKTLPKYTMLRVVRDTPTRTILSLVYDRKDNLNGFRWTCSHTFDSSISIPNALQHLQEKLREKYGANIGVM
jgi:hypothetical protein